MTFSEDSRQGPGRPEALIIIGMAETPPPNDSLVWRVLDDATVQLTQRIARAHLFISPPQVLKMRYLTPHIGHLLSDSPRAVLIGGFNGTQHPRQVVHYHRAPAPPSPPPPFGDRDLEGLIGEAHHELADPDLVIAETPGGSLTGELHYLPATAEELAQLPAWLETEIPHWGLDILGLPLPPARTPAHFLPHLGTWLPELIAPLAGMLWEILQDAGGDQASDPRVA